MIGNTLEVAGPAAGGALEVYDPDRHLSAETVAALVAAVPDNTRRAFGADRRLFADWCTEQGRSALPATAETLAEYVTYLTTTPRPRTGKPYGPASIERALTSISTWHTEQGRPKPVMKGARLVLSEYRDRLARAGAPEAQPQQAEPATPDKLRALLAGLDRATLAGKRDAALVLLGFAVAGRVSELAALNIDSVREAGHGYDVHVYRGKVRKHTVIAILYGSDPTTCPVRALAAYLGALADVGRADGPLFVRIDRHGRVAPPLFRKGRAIGDPTGRTTPDAIGDVVARLADRASLEGEWSGHSLRRGFATAARAAGHDPLEIARQGGWADGSPTLARYMAAVDRVTKSPLIGIGL